MFKVKRLFAILLALVMVVSIIPTTVFAAAEEGDSQPESTQTREGEPVTTTVPEDTTSGSGDADGDEPVAAAAIPEEATPVSSEPAETEGEDIGTTDNGKVLFRRHTILFKSGDVNVGGSWRTGVIICGIRDANIKVEDFETYQEFLKAYWGSPVYCIEPGTEAQWDEEHADTTVTSEDVWASLTRDQRYAVGLTMLYGAPNGMKGGTQKQQIINEVVTAVIIQEICMGWRSPTPPYERLKNDYFAALCWGDDSTIYSSMYNGLNGTTITADELWEAYTTLEGKLKAHNAVPSFAARREEFAPTHVMTENADGTYRIVLRDESEVGVVKKGLYDFSALSTNGLSVVVNKTNGTVTITANSMADIPTEPLAPVRDDVPNMEESVYTMWQCSGASGQTTMQVQEGVFDPVPAYFKLRAAGGTINLTKTTSDGENLAGWQFGIYLDEDCTELYSGPFETDEEGKIEEICIPAGTFYVKEIGHKDAQINALYECTSQNPQQVTSVVDGVYDLTFENEFLTGALTVQKYVNDQKWTSAHAAYLAEGESIRFRLWNDEYGYDQTVSVNEAGVAAFTGLRPGQYKLQEVECPQGFWYCDTGIYEVTIIAKETVVYNHNNAYGGGMTIKKASDDNKIDNIEFYVRSAASGEEVFHGFTSEDGTLAVDKLPVGEYIVEEVVPDGYICEGENPVTVTVKENETTVVPFTNSKNTGSLEIQKETNTGGDLGGWVIGVYTDAECENPISGSPFTTDEDGKIHIDDLSVGTYYAKELTDDKHGEDWLCDNEVKTLVVAFHETATATFYNQQMGRIEAAKETNTGNDLDGWIFGVYDANGQQVDTVTTDETGKGLSKYLLPGEYTVREIGSTDDKFDSQYWTCDIDSKTVTVAAAETNTVSFYNIHFGNIRIVKEIAVLTNPNNPVPPLDGEALFSTESNLAGWEFILTDAEGKVYGPYLTDENGCIITENLIPGIYTVTEVIPEDSPYECITENPQTVEVVEGETAEVKFTNRLRSGVITILKTDSEGNVLPGAVFKLEWSADGENWEPVVCTDTLTVGGCFNIGIEDGCLTSDESGMLSWTGLYLGLRYRVSEVSAPNGYERLQGYVYLDELPTDILTVKNTKVDNPKTGDNAPIGFYGASASASALGMAMLFGYGWNTKRKTVL